MVAANGKLPRPARDALIVEDATSARCVSRPHAHAEVQSGGIWVTRSNDNEDLFVSKKKI